MTKRSDSKNFIESVVLSIAALGIYNCVLQFIIYPYLNRTVGEEAFGDVLALLSVLSVGSMSIGVGANYSRLANKPRFESSNGDYNAFLCIGSAVAAVAGVVSLMFFDSISTLSYILFPVLSIVMIFRYYSEADFRLSVNYRKNFIFYMIITTGMLVGLFLFRLTKSFETAMLMGEIPALIYVFFSGTVLKKPFFKKSPMHKNVIRSCAQLTGSQFFSNLTLNCDRILISALSTGTDVTVYYTASLLGKAMALLTGPVSGVLLGFLAKAEKFGRKQFLLCSVVTLVAGAAAFCVFIPLAPFIIGILYPDTAQQAGRYFLLANGGQIIYFVSNLLLVIVLRFAKEKLQLYINVVYFVLFIIASLLSLIFGDLFVFCAATFALNTVRLIAILLLGIRYSKA
ncbi:MAG: oligosaccharide flippase family protein [Clostridia bacterium]|nr:oligosaccharide flippase family protein [Clostridia bacterium]